MADSRSPALQELDRQIKENVQKGLVFLRENYGEDWVDHIDLETLELTDASCCVLGQVHPVYHTLDEYEEGFDAAINHFSVQNYGREYGFAVSNDDEDPAWRMLQEAWEEVIPDEQRRVRRKREAGLL